MTDHQDDQFVRLEMMQTAVDADREIGDLSLELSTSLKGLARLAGALDRWVTPDSNGKFDQTRMGILFKVFTWCKFWVTPAEYARLAQRIRRIANLLRGIETIPTRSKQFRRLRRFCLELICNTLPPAS